MKPQWSEGVEEWGEYDFIFLTDSQIINYCIGHCKHNTLDIVTVFATAGMWLHNYYLNCPGVNRLNYHARDKELYRSVF